MPDLTYVFSEEGPLATALPGFRARTGQLEMAKQVEQAIENKSVLIAEAGTGTGKTLAYLVPALLSQGKVIVSTGTRHLQDQLFHRDLPLVRAALCLPVAVALLKGRANYICHYHLQRAVEDGRFQSRETVAHLEQIRVFSEHSQTGDKAELSGIPDDAAVWQHATSTRENCLSGECPQISQCFVFAARKRAMEADLVVVNHHLFFADVWLRDEGVAELLPVCNTVIFDEAHQLPDTAGVFFGETVSTGYLLNFAREVRLEAAVRCKDYPVLTEAAATLEKALRDFRLSFVEDNVRWPIQRFQQREGCVAALTVCVDALNTVNTHLELQAARASELELAWQNGLEQAARLLRWQQDDNQDTVRWLEVFGQSVALNATPLSVAEIFSSQMGDARSWIFTSATMSVKGDFSHFRDQMGLEGADSHCWDSPFDYDQQAMLYVPKIMPDPNASDYTAAVIQAALPLLVASEGRAFLLFTSLRAMRDARRMLEEYLKLAKLDYPILMQGERPRGELLEQFRTLSNPILLGSQSFWEGVDVKGEALSLVVIDRLPFSPPDDPVLAARIEQIKRAGGNAFIDHQLPHAVITLKQGAGRLIRDENDRGVLMICDPRLISKPYGRRIWQSLPPMRRSRVESEAVDFLAKN
jgi:ATP-dependent DNA helicase DinG